MYCGCVDVMHACYEYQLSIKLEKGMKIDLFKLDMNILHFGGKHNIP